MADWRLLGGFHQETRLDGALKRRARQFETGHHIRLKPTISIDKNHEFRGMIVQIGYPVG